MDKKLKYKKSEYIINKVFMPNLILKVMKLPKGYNLFHEENSLD